tara:strand:- start:206 stop:577 length:372 start_codon:yes stop_codon:yes gene_type:complete
MTKLRELILERRWADKAFVSIRIMMSMKATYLVFRDVDNSQQINKDNAIKTPKTLKDSLDSFIGLFSETQQVTLREETNYDEFINIVNAKNNLPVDQLDTDAEIKSVNSIIEANEVLQRQANA